MLLYKSFLVILLSLNLFASNYLNSNYYIDLDTIMLSDIIQDSHKRVELYKIPRGRYSLRVKAKEVIKLLKKNGFKDFKSRHSYIQFTKKSPIDTSRIKSRLKQIYKSKYKSINIKKITITPRNYMESLPKFSIVKIQSRAYLSKSGILYIKTENKREIFFNYEILAYLSVYKARKNIKRNMEISLINSLKNSIILDKFNAMPIEVLQKATIEAKHYIKKGTILTKRDVKTLSLVKRGSFVNVSLDSGGISISSSAKSLQNGKYGDTIKVQQNSGKIIRVIVTGKNRVEIR